LASVDNDEATPMDIDEPCNEVLLYEQITIMPPLDAVTYLIPSQVNTPNNNAKVTDQELKWMQLELCKVKIAYYTAMTNALLKKT
jgi:hypothetical protein